MSGQLARLAFVEARDGKPAAIAFARQTLGLYRSTVVQRKTHTMYRRRLIEAYLTLKQYLKEAK